MWTDNVQNTKYDEIERILFVKEKKKKLYKMIENNTWSNNVNNDNEKIEENLSKLFAQSTITEFFNSIVWVLGGTSVSVGAVTIMIMYRFQVFAVQIIFREYYIYIYIL